MPRVVDGLTEQSSAILIEGARACGKTPTGLQHGRSAVLLDTDDSARPLAEINTALILDGVTQRLTASTSYRWPAWGCDRVAPGMRGVDRSLARPVLDLDRHLPGPGLHAWDAGGQGPSAVNGQVTVPSASVSAGPVPVTMRRKAGAPALEASI